MSPLRYCAISWVALLANAGAAAPIEFNRDIRPILSENCFQCHGQDAAKREAKLRLDQRESATRDRGGYAPIVPGKPNESDVILRITSKDPEERMPPAESHKSVTPAQVEQLRAWIAQGAKYEKHWAFEAIRRAAVPVIGNQLSVISNQSLITPKLITDYSKPIDAFVLARLEREGLAPAAEAKPETWLRRASFDLIGLPPTPEELDAFAAEVKQRGEKAYEAAAERLLASPHFGERQAIEWLDAARYADTHGFNNDSARTMWRWRDWVIEAFNANLPYDRFITEQLAGDLLPKPTLEQRIATGFGRNHVINSEGGIIDEEYRVEYVADRVRTLSTAWLGLTMECAKCHDHKFDPVTQRDYYRLFAFFNNVPEHGEDGRVANAYPMIPAPTREQQAELAAQGKEIAALDGKIEAARKAWTWRGTDRARLEERFAAARTKMEAVKSVALVEKGKPEDASKIPAAKLDFAAKEGVAVEFWMRPAADNPRDVALISSLNYGGSKADAQYGKGRELRLIEGEVELRVSDRYPVYALIVRTEGAAIQAGKWRHVAVTYAGGKKAEAVRIFVDGSEVAVRVRYDGLQNEPPKKEWLVGVDNNKDSAKWSGELEDLRGFARALKTEEVRAAFQVGALRKAGFEPELSGVKPDLQPDALEWVREVLLAEAATRELVAQRAALWEKHLALRRSLPTAMVMQELPEPRPAFVLERGQYELRRERVDAGVPEELLASWPAGAPRNRLGLAQWLTQPQHPLTARVVVNRFWAQLFGTGLVKTLEDFGSQGEWPSHPELLDWLARDFIDGGWNVKALLRTLVLSATYRQSSAVTPALLARDPENRLLARGPRVRLPAELIRDQALAISGLLAPRIGGPSVYPYQPDRLYEGLVVGADYPGTKWKLSAGDDLHRRGLYTFWKRTVPHPVMTSFDAPDREFCTVRRSRTNTPLQALILWNEPGYLEAARALGRRMLRERSEDEARVSFGFRLATGRVPSQEETRVLAQALRKFREDFAKNPDEASDLLSVGVTDFDGKTPLADAAAAMSVASMLLGLDETITKN